MEKSIVLEIIKREKLVPVVRTNNQDDARKVIKALAACGNKVFEITMTVPNAIDLIADLSESNSDIYSARERF